MAARVAVVLGFAPAAGAATRRLIAARQPNPTGLARPGADDNAGAPRVSSGGDHVPLDDFRGATVEMTRRTRRGRDLAAAWRALLDTQRAALREVVRRQPTGAVAMGEDRRVETAGKRVAPRQARPS